MLLRRSLIYFRRTHIATMAGAAIGTAVLTGALLVGDSVRDSLVAHVDRRLGHTRHAVVCGEQFVGAALAQRLGKALNVEAAGLIAVRGVASVPATDARANRVDVYGVDRTMGALVPDGRGPAPPPGGVTLNRRLAAHLNVAKGDTVILRPDRPGGLHRDLALAGPQASGAGLRLVVHAVVSDSALGNLGFRAEQRLPMNAFVQRDTLADAMEQAHRINLILLAGEGEGEGEGGLAREALARHMSAQDYGLSVRRVAASKVWELRSGRVFLETPLVEAALEAVPEAWPVFGYFVNALEHAGKRTPYSVVAAPGPPVICQAMPDDHIVVNRWLADDLGLSEGAALTLHYDRMAPGRVLVATQRQFRVEAIVPIEGAAADPELMPSFPGLADVGNCRDWDTGLSLELDRIRPEDEAYWDAHRGTPKAFVSLAAAQAMWRNRFGVATAIRWPATGLDGTPALERLTALLAPEMVGVHSVAVYAEGMRAGRGGVDFGELFLALNFFIVAAALLLAGMLFGFSALRREAESGVLLAVGWTRARVLRERLAEAACLALPGALLGGMLGVGYTRATLMGLGSVWRGAVGDATLVFSPRLETVAVGMTVGMAAAWLAMGWATWRQLRRRPGDLQRGVPAVPVIRPRGPWRYVPGVVCWLAAALAAVWIGPGGGSRVAARFFGIGALALAGSLLLVWAFLLTLRRGGSGAPGLIRAGVLAMAVRAGQSVGAMALLAMGVFLVIATGANRPGLPPGAGDRKGGTGGFAFFADAARPVLEDPNGLAGTDGTLVPLRVAEGDDASCLNLNRATQPPLWGVNPDRLDALRAFSVAEAMDAVVDEHFWLALHGPLSDGAIPAIADQTVIVWGLGRKVGDTIDVRDGRGRVLTLRLVAGLRNSICQGAILISDENFLRAFPREPGYRVFLVDRGEEDLAELQGRLARVFRDYGMDVQPAMDRLASFALVQDTYLAIFLVLGGLGLLLGSIGMAIVAARDILDRRHELAMLRAVGFSRGHVRRYCLAGHAAILIAGLAAGGVAGLVAAWPALRAQGAALSPTPLLLLLLGLAVHGMVWVFVAVAAVTRGALMPALREE